MIGQAVAGLPERRELRRPPDPMRGGLFVVARELVFVIAVALAVAVTFKTFVAQAFFIPTGSMLPQLQLGDRVIVSKVSYRLHDPNRGDIVVFHNPNPPPDEPESVPERAVREVLEAFGIRAPSTEEFIKRVIGLPGETVEGRDGRVYVDGLELVEPYLPEGTVTSDFSPVQVPEGTLWVMGDNRRGSLDSRSFGPVDRSTVVGRAVVKAWPVPDMSFL